MTFDDMETSHMEERNKVLPSGPAVPSSSLKKPKVDVSTNVYQSEILSETKSVFFKPSMVKKLEDTDQELYAVVYKEV